MKRSIYDWLQDKRANNEEIRLISLLIDVDNSPLLKSATSKLIEEGAVVEVDENQFDTSTKEGKEKLDRFFHYVINKEALDMLIKRTEIAIEKVATSEKVAKELLNRTDIDKETIDEIAGELAQERTDALKESKRVAFIKDQFEDDDNVKDFIDSGSVWFSDKQLTLDVIDALEEVKDENVDNFMTASALIARIDKLISRINRTIEKIDLYQNGEEENIEIDGVKELEEDAQVTSNPQEASEREVIEETNLPELRPEKKREQEVSQEQESNKEHNNDNEEKQKKEEKNKTAEKIKSESQKIAEERAKAKKEEAGQEEAVVINIGL